jgi:LysM repeat protein
MEKKMATKHLFVFIVLALFSLGLAACELSASTPPPAVATDEGSMGTLEAVLGNIATQTFVAGGGDVTPVAETPQAPAETPSSEETPAEEQGEEPAEPEPTEPPEEEEAEPEPAEPSPVEVPSPTPGIPASYTLQDGEFPFCIARRFNVDQYELLNINGLSLNSRPQVGFNLRIPQTGNPFSGDRSLQDHPTNYTVGAGETIYSIACKFGDVDPLSIARANGLEPPYTVRAGDRIHIPEY